MRVLNVPVAPFAVFCLLICCGCPASPPPDPDKCDALAGPLQQSQFASGDDGWRVAGGNFAESTRPVWDATNLRITATSNGDVYWVAPAALLGDWSDFYGGWLSYTLTGSPCGYGYRSAEALQVSGNGLTLYTNLAVIPEAYGSAYAFWLDESAAWYVLNTDARASQSQLRSVLGCVSDLRIRANASICDIPIALAYFSLRSSAFELPQPAGQRVESTFDAGDGGWRLAGGNFAEPTRPSWSAAGQRIEGIATGDVFWLAPASFHGDFSAYYEGQLQFELTGYLCGYGSNWDQAVVLAGGGESIYYRFTDSFPTEAGTAFALQLDEREQWFDRATHERVTAGQFQRLLGALAELRIRANGSICDVPAGLDNVALRAP